MSNKFKDGIFRFRKAKFRSEIHPTFPPSRNLSAAVPVTISCLPIQVLDQIIDLVAKHDPDSLPRCALVSRQWNSHATYHLKIMFYHWSPISCLPTELIHQIIDLVAQHHPDSLPGCALVSRRWNPRATYHLGGHAMKPCRHIRITAIPELHAFLDIAKKDSYLAQYPKSLNISPDPDVSSTSYIPFLDLSSRILPNVNRLILGEGLRWIDYPPLYNNGVVGSPFHSVTILDLHCRFKSPQSFFRAVRSFRNLEEVRLLHPDPFFPNSTYSSRSEHASRYAFPFSSQVAETPPVARGPGESPLVLLPVDGTSLKCLQS